MGGMSPIHWVILGVIVLVLFGGGKISGMMGDLAKGIKSFKKGLEEDDHPAPPAKISSAQPAAENASVAQAAQNPHPAQKQAAEQDAHFDGKS